MTHARLTAGTTAHSAPGHWAAPLIGCRYEPRAAGPLSFDCWGLVRYVFATRYGADLPELPLGETVDDGASLVLQAVRATGFSRVYAVQPAADDVVLMRNAEGGRHIGVLIHTRLGLRILHACSGVGVRAQPLQDLPLEGFGRFEFWRRGVEC